MSRAIALTIFISMLGLASASAQQNPLIGSWKTNTAKTVLQLGPPTTDNLTTIEPSGPDGIKVISRRTDTTGETNTMEYTVQLDGKTYPYVRAGGAARDGVAIRQINDHTYQLSYKLKGETVQMNYWIVSPDGKTLTTVSTGLTGDGQVYSRLMVKDKQ